LPEDWETRAEQVRARDGYRCQNCGKTQQENRRRLSVDHILPRRWFADPSEADDPANLISRCGSCHGKKTARAERKLLRGDIIAFQQHLKELNTYVNEP
jgi:5-methylcytosine-specific restriction endonuclease McrA